MSESGVTHASQSLRDVLKEIGRRIELRQRLEAERGLPIDDGDFLRIAERTGIKI